MKPSIMHPSAMVQGIAIVQDDTKRRGKQQIGRSTRWIYGIAIGYYPRMEGYTTLMSCTNDLDDIMLNERKNNIFNKMEML